MKSEFEILNNLQVHISCISSSLKAIELLLNEFSETAIAKQDTGSKESGAKFGTQEDERLDPYGKFQKLLRERGLRPSDVSKATGVSTATLSDWKKGVYKPKVNKLMLIAKYFNVPVSYFLEDEEQT